MLLLDPAPPTNLRSTRAGILVLIAVSALSLLLAPLLMPESYSWKSNFISESAAQGVSGSWLARCGFLAFGFAVVWLSIVMRSDWVRGANWCHLAFGICMISAAAFSHRPWIAGAAFDPFEDYLHSVFATAMGFAFALGVLFVLLRAPRRETTDVIFHVTVIAASVVFPLAGSVWPEIAGVSQRLMFLVAYAWYGREALGRSRTADPPYAPL